MKKLIIALILPLLFSCSKDEETQPDFTANLADLNIERKPG